jgi:hypothetical protein
MIDTGEYEPDYDAMWQEFVELDEMAIFYAAHEQENYPMTEETKGLPVRGYKPTQPQWALDLVNENKILEERILRQIDRHKELGADLDQRHVAIARTEIEKAFMSLNRAVFQPQRIKLPEDGE